MSTARSRRATILGRILVVLGATLAGGCVLFVFSTLWAPSADGHTWKSEAGPIYLTSSSRTDEPESRSRQSLRRDGTFRCHPHPGSAPSTSPELGFTPGLTEPRACPVLPERT